MVALTTNMVTFEGDTSSIDTEQRVPLGSRALDADGNEYIYLQGVANVANNVVVTFDELFQTALIAANAVGRVAIARAAVVANTFGWFQIYGTGTASCDTIAADVACYIDATAGRVDDAVVTGDLILGMFSRSTDTSNVCTVDMTYPFVTNVLG